MKEKILISGFAEEICNIFFFSALDFTRERKMNTRKKQKNKKQTLAQRK